MFANILTRGVAISASILLHVALLFFGYYAQQHNPLSDIVPLYKTEKLEKKTFEWVSTKAAISQFGAPVTFEAIPEMIPEPIIKENETNKSEENFEQNKAMQSDIIENIKQIPEKQKILQKAQPNKPKTKQNNHAETSPKMLNKKITLSQLANGFLDHVKAKGNDRITTKGNIDGLPTDEQLKHQRYIEKIAWCWQNSFKIHMDKLPNQNKHKLKVFLALNKNGTINQLSIMSSSGDLRIDRFVLFLFQDAQSSFPPVPKYFDQDPYVIPCLVSLDHRYW